MHVHVHINLQMGSKMTLSQILKQNAIKFDTYYFLDLKIFVDSKTVMISRNDTPCTCMWGTYNG